MSNQRETQQDVASELGVTSSFNPATEVQARTAFLADFVADTAAQALVLGVSGGVDSAVAAMLCRRATHQHGAASFIAVRLPYGHQLDAADAAAVLTASEPDRVFTVDIQPATDSTLTALSRAGLSFTDPSQRDFVLGNIKARERMVTQYAIANTTNARVVGTDHAAEAVTGFFTKYGDGGVDINPLAGLTKRRVRALATLLGLPDAIVHKQPTADLESLRPQYPDEQALGVTYDQIDDFLEGRPVSPDTADMFISRYLATTHKRNPPASYA